MWNTPPEMCDALSIIHLYSIEIYKLTLGQDLAPMVDTVGVWNNPPPPPCHPCPLSVCRCFTPIILSWIKLLDDTAWSISEYIGIKTAMEGEIIKVLEGEMIKVIEEEETLQVSASPKHMWWSIHGEGETAVNSVFGMQPTCNVHATYMQTQLSI